MPLLHKKNTAKEAVTDPLRDAAMRFGGVFSVCKSCTGWEGGGTFHTTGEFGALDGGYLRHCGPTAIVNVLCTLEAFQPQLTGRHLNAGRAFRRIARLGIKRHYYWNHDLLRFFGGTFNFLAPAYLRAALKIYGREDVRIRRARPALSFFLKQALEEGAILYLETFLHPRYGNHHLLAYGYRELVNDRGKKKLYLVVADGWDNAPRYLAADSIRTGRFLRICADRAPGEL